MASISNHRRFWLVAAFMLLAWLGEYIHNVVELPQLTVLSSANSIPALIFLLLFAGWWLLPYRSMTAVLITVWAIIQLVGGAIITVVPFSFLPFYPEQSLRHYLTHLLYGMFLFTVDKHHNSIHKPRPTYNTLLVV